MRVLIIGCGKIAGGFDKKERSGGSLTHASAYHRHPSFSITGCIDPDPHNRLEFQSKWSVAEGFASIDEAFSGGRHYDVASICSPTHLHEVHLEELLERPVEAVFCEKPVGRDCHRVQDLVERFERAGKALAVNYLRRWDPELRALTQQIRDGEWGAVRSIVGYYNKGLLNNGSHIIDIIVSMVGPLRVAHAVRAKSDDGGDDPSFDALLHADDGTGIHLVAGDARDYVLLEVQILTERGVIAIERAGLSIRVREAGPSPLFAGYMVLGEGCERPGASNDGIDGAVDNIYQHLMEGRPLACTGRDALALLQTCRRIEREAMP